MSRHWQFRILPAMVWFLYNVLFIILYPLMLPRFLWRMMKRGGYRRGFLQRVAMYDAETRRTLATGERVWLQAVSVGEVYVAVRIMEAMRKVRPDMHFVLSTTTSTGYAIAREQIKAPDVLFYFPVDVPPVMRRVLRLVRPRMLVLVETEFWPNLVRLCRRRDIPVVLVNGRISPKSFRGYSALRMFTSRLLPELQIMCMQSKSDRDRLVALGAPPERVVVPGSAKYEIVERDAEAEARAREVLRLAGIAADAPILLGGSTWPGEEEILLDAYKELKASIPSLALVLVPRHVERSKDVIGVIEQRGLPYVRRSALSAEHASDRPPAEVLLVDTTGELKHFYACATVIFVGKSLTAHGGQNVIEPAVYQKPIVVGPNMENFPGIMEDFLEANALCQVRDEKELRAALSRLLANPDECRELGARAARLVAAQAGVVDRTIELILPFLDKTR